MLQRARIRAHAWWRTIAAPDGRRPRWLVIAACALVTIMYCTNQDMGGDPRTPRGDGVYRPVLARGDGHMMYLMARSTALDGDWRFNNDLGRFGDPWNQTLGADGRKVIPHPIGPPLVWTPLIWIAELGAVAANQLGADIPLHGYTPWHQRFVFFSSVIFACATVLLGRRLAQRAVGGTWAPSYAAVAILLGTSLTYYATYMPSYGHALDAFACAGFLAYWAFTLGRSDRARWVVLGALLGGAALIRVQELAMAVVLVVEALHDLLGPARRRDERWIRSLARWLVRGVVVMAVAGLMLVPQLGYWKIVYGDWLAVPQGAKYTRFGSPMMLEVLYAARNGWFSTTPIAYAAVVGLFLLPRRSRLLAAGLLATVALQVYLNSTIMDYWGMAGFGQRRLCSVTIALVVGLAALIAQLGRFGLGPLRLRQRPWLAHALLVAALGVFIAWNLMRVGQHRAGRAATSELVPTCCDRVPPLLRGPTRAIFDVIGNPFEFPANLLFAIRHGVSLQRWDTAVGNYPMVPPANALYDGTLWSQRGTWSIGGPGAAPYLIGGWTPPQKSPERGFRSTTTRSATVLVPNLMPYPQRGKLWLAPAGASAVKLSWDGAVIASPTLAPGWQRVELDLPSWSVGEHELSFESPDIGISVGALEIEFAPDNRARYGN